MRTDTLNRGFRISLGEMKGAKVEAAVRNVLSQQRMEWAPDSILLVSADLGTKFDIFPGILIRVMWSNSTPLDIESIRRQTANHAGIKCCLLRDFLDGKPL